MINQEFEKQTASQYGLGVASGSDNKSQAEESSSQSSLLSRFNLFKRDVYKPLHQYRPKTFLITCDHQNEMLDTLVGICADLVSLALESQQYPQSICSIGCNEENTEISEEYPSYIDQITYGMPLYRDLKNILDQKNRISPEEKKHYKFLDMAIEKIEAHLFADRPWIYGHSASTKLLQDGDIPFKALFALELENLIRNEHEDYQNWALPDITNDKYKGDYKDQYVEDMFKEFKVFIETVYLVGSTAAGYEPKESKSWFSRSNPNQ